MVKVNSFCVEYRGETLSLDFIFGTPRKQEIRGFPIKIVVDDLSEIARLYLEAQGDR